MLHVTCLVVATSLGVAPARPAAEPAAGAASLQQSVRAEVARMVRDRKAPAPTPARHAPRRQTWVQRHPVRTAAIIGAASGFLAGYLPGDDAVFDDYVAEFNGVVVGGIGAGAGASIVAIIQALRTPLPAGRGKAGAGSGTAAPPRHR